MQFKTVTDHKFIAQECHDVGCQFLVLKEDLEILGERGDFEKMRADIAEEKVAKLQEQLAWHKQQMNEGYKVPALEEKVARLEKERDEARKELDAKTNSH